MGAVFPPPSVGLLHLRHSVTGTLGRVTHVAAIRSILAAGHVGAAVCNCRVATRYDRCPTVFFSAVALAATVIFWL